MRRSVAIAVLTSTFAASCAGASISSTDPAYGSPVRIVSPSTDSVWNVTVEAPIPVRAVSDSNTALSADIELELVEAASDSSTYDFRWELVGGASGETYAAFPSELLDPPACPLPRTPYQNGTAPLGYSIVGSVCFLVTDPRDVEHPNTRVTLGEPLAMTFSPNGQEAEDSLGREPVVPDGLPFDTRIELADTAAQDSSWFIEMAPLEILDEEAWPDWNFDPLAPGMARVGVRYSVDGLATPETLAPPDVYVLGGASERVSRQSCDLLRSLATIEARNNESHRIEWCLVVPASDVDHPETRIGVNFAGADLRFSGSTTPEL